MKHLKQGRITRRSLSLLLALLLLLPASPALAGEGQGGAPIRWDRDELVVGSFTALKGDFFLEMTSNSTADIDLRALVHGYNIIHWDENQGVYLFDPSVVRDTMISTDSLGNKTYYIALHDDLRYSDGSPITAWDFAFGLLLTASPEVAEIGCAMYRAEHILGYDRYVSKAVPYLEGLKVLDEHQLAITLDHSALPYFFELSLLLCNPYPIEVIAPGCRVRDDGLGVYIANEDPGVKEPLFTAELLRRTIMDPETGYNTRPSLSSGPYTLTAFDGVTAHLELNPWFKGVPKKFLYGMGGALSGETLVKPAIRRIAYTRVDADTLGDDLINGRIDLVNKVVYASAIEGGLASGMQYVAYPRSGLSFVNFTYENPAVREMKVRQAIAWCMDRDQLTEDYCGEYGFRVDSYYGSEQWEYLMVTGQIRFPYNFVDEIPYEQDERYSGVNLHTLDDRTARLWDGVNLDGLTAYRVDLAKANDLLDSAGWTLDENGGPYEPGDVRSKRVDGDLVSLRLTLMYPEGNHIVDTMQENFIDNLNACGIRLALVPTPMRDLLTYYYREQPRTTDMIYLATNFHGIIDPAILWSADGSVNHQYWSNIYSDDAQLYYLAVDMRQTDPKDVYDYITKWVLFEKRYNEVLPSIPVYTNTYYDFWAPGLTNYDITAHVTWSQAIFEASFTGRPDAEVAVPGR